MRNRSAILWALFSSVIALHASAVPVAAAKIEAVKGKTYTLSKRHGPWMIMVASFSAGLRGETEQQLRNAENAAHDLVYELRQKGIPAYVYKQKGKLAEVDSFDRTGTPAQRYVAQQRNQICVIAGNYPSVDDETAQKTLKYIKQLYPKSLENGVYKSTPGRPGPLSRAFLTMNPLLTPQEIAEQTRHSDPLLLHLNSNSEYNLTDNPGRYTLIIASFQGKQKMSLGGTENSRSQSKLLDFDLKIQKESQLDEAGFDSWALVKALRAQGVEAYVFHERFRSVVTVGAFDSPEDPRIVQTAQTFGAKVKQDPRTGQEALVCESVKLDDGQLWVLDPQPQLMSVPRLRRR